MDRLFTYSHGVFLRYSTIAIVLLSLAVQFVLIGQYLDNSIISAYAPTAADAADYAGRAQVWQTEGFEKAFSDGFRMPGYPLVILFMNFVMPSAPYLGVRLLQMLGLALSAGIINVVLQKIISRRVAVLVSSLYIFLPIWHFVPALLAESLTSAIVVALVYVLATLKYSEISWQHLVKISILIVIATYLKPNNLALLIVVFGFLIFTLRARIIISLSSIVLMVALLLSPWVLFVNDSQPGFFGLTTNSGMNLYVGTGMVLNYDESLLAKSAVKWRVDPRNNPTDIRVDATAGSPVIQNSKFTDKAIQIWKERPLREIGYGIDKILIAFGFKSNSVTDYVYGLFNALSLISAALLIRSRTFRAWGVTTLITALVLASQAAVFQADRRFVVPVLFPIAVISLGIALGNLPRSNFWGRSTGSPISPKGNRTAPPFT
jgi:hypothetical protein